MANARFWDPVLLSKLSLNELFEVSAGLQIITDLPTDIRGTIYQDYFYLTWNEPDSLRSVELYGNDLEITESGVSGTVNAIANWFKLPDQDWDYNTFIKDFSIAASTIFSAMLSESTEDDIAVFRTIFAGKDRVTLSINDDEFFSGAGRDTIEGKAGNDTIAAEDGNDIVRGNMGRDSLMGGTGDDSVIGGEGSDRIFGNKGHDLLKGDAGDDTISGGDGRDSITGGAGDDQLAGGSKNDQADHFFFGSNDGEDRILDFDNGSDMLIITSGADQFADLSISAFADGTRIAFADTVILLNKVGIAAISAADFDFI